MALAEYWSSALRAQGSVWTALVPRDIIWRVAAPVAVVGVFAFGGAVDGWVALLVTAATLVLALGLQYGAAGGRGYEIAPGFAEIGAYWRERGAASRWFLIGTVIDKTPVGGPGSDRGDEIVAWLAEHDVAGYVIIDDHSDMGALRSRLVLTQPARGLQPADAARAIAVLMRPLDGGAPC